MKADDTQTSKMLDGRVQFVIPLFQRPYVWKEKKWETLWSDIKETHEMGPSARHFLGSIVVKVLKASPEGVSLFLVIDGQQRLTTLTLLLAAIRDAAKPADAKLAGTIQDVYLTNIRIDGIDRYKVLPSQDDRTVYFNIIDHGVISDHNSYIAKAYAYFSMRVSEFITANPNIGLKQLEQLVTQQLEMVSIKLTDDDNEYRIFESLNVKGERLTQADLLRNYFFMCLPPQLHSAVYAELWEPMQTLLQSSNLADFFRYEFMSERGEFVRKEEIYLTWKKRLEDADGKCNNPDKLVEELKHLESNSHFYEHLITPESEPDKRVREHLRWLNRWGGQTMYPFLLYVYKKYKINDIDAKGFAEILTLIESFLVRRLFSGVPPDALNRLFLRLPQQLPAGLDLVEGTKAILSEPSRRWPRDADFARGILEYPLYLNGRAEQRKLILERFEESYGHKEKPDLDASTIEHIMPQTITPDWVTMLGSNAKDIQARLLNVLGNLTLTGYNSELGNKPFGEKKKLLEGSNLQMNKEIAAAPVWTEEQIMERGRRLAKRAIKIWPGPKD